jgi:hypothetical protein
MSTQLAASPPAASAGTAIQAGKARQATTNKDRWSEIRQRLHDMRIPLREAER